MYNYFFGWIINNFHWHFRLITVVAFCAIKNAVAVIIFIQHFSNVQQLHGPCNKRKYWSIYETFIFRKYILPNVTNNFIWFKFSTS